MTTAPIATNNLVRLRRAGLTTTGGGLNGWPGAPGCPGPPPTGGANRCAAPCGGPGGGGLPHGPPGDGWGPAGCGPHGACCCGGGCGVPAAPPGPVVWAGPPKLCHPSVTRATSNPVRECTAINRADSSSDSELSRTQIRHSCLLAARLWPTFLGEQTRAPLKFRRTGGAGVCSREERDCLPTGSGKLPGAGVEPHPSSATVSTTRSPVRVSRTRTVPARACRYTLAGSSRAARYSSCCESGLPTSSRSATIV